MPLLVDSRMLPQLSVLVITISLSTVITVCDGQILGLPVKLDQVNFTEYLSDPEKQIDFKCDEPGKCTAKIHGSTATGINAWTQPSVWQQRPPEQANDTFYVLDVVADQSRVTFTTCMLGNTIDTYLGVFEYAGFIRSNGRNSPINRVMDNDDHDGECGDGAIATDSIVSEILLKGKYVVVVEGRNNTQGNFSLVVRSTPARSLRDELARTSTMTCELVNAVIVTTDMFNYLGDGRVDGADGFLKFTVKKETEITVTTCVGIESDVYSNNQLMLYDADELAKVAGDATCCVNKTTIKPILENDDWSSFDGLDRAASQCDRFGISDAKDAAFTYTFQPNINYVIVIQGLASPFVGLQTTFDGRFNLSVVCKKPVTTTQDPGGPCTHDQKWCPDKAGDCTLDWQWKGCPCYCESLTTPLSSLSTTPTSNAVPKIRVKGINRDARCTNTQWRKSVADGVDTTIDSCAQLAAADDHCGVYISYYAGGEGAPECWCNTRGDNCSDVTFARNYQVYKMDIERVTTTIATTTSVECVEAQYCATSWGKICGTQNEYRCPCSCAGVHNDTTPATTTTSTLAIDTTPTLPCVDASKLCTVWPLTASMCSNVIGTVCPCACDAIIPDSTTTPTTATPPSSTTPSTPTTPTIPTTPTAPTTPCNPSAEPKACQQLSDPCSSADRCACACANYVLPITPPFIDAINNATNVTCNKTVSGNTSIGYNYVFEGAGNDHFYLIDINTTTMVTVSTCGDPENEIDTRIALITRSNIVDAALKNTTLARKFLAQNNNFAKQADGTKLLPVANCSRKDLGDVSDSTDAAFSVKLDRGVYIVIVTGIYDKRTAEQFGSKFNGLYSMNVVCTAPRNDNSRTSTTTPMIVTSTPSQTDVVSTSKSVPPVSSTVSVATVSVTDDSVTTDPSTDISTSLSPSMTASPDSQSTGSMATAQSQTPTTQSQTTTTTTTTTTFITGPTTANADSTQAPGCTENALCSASACSDDVTALLCPCTCTSVSPTATIGGITTNGNGGISTNAGGVILTTPAVVVPSLTPTPSPTPTKTSSLVTSASITTTPVGAMSTKNPTFDSSTAKAVSKSTTAMYIAGVAGGVVVIAIIVGVVFIVCRKSSASSSFEPSKVAFTNPLYEENEPTNGVVTPANGYLDVDV